MSYLRLPRLAWSSTPALVAALALACGEETTTEVPAEGLCPLAGPTLLAAAPADWDPGENYPGAGISILDDRLLYFFGDHGRADRYLVDLCGGEPQRIPVGDRYGSINVIDSPQGKVLIGSPGIEPNETIDRLDVPGLDKPRKIAGIPIFTPSPEVSLAFSTRTLDPGVVYGFTRVEEGQRFGFVAGLGHATSHVFYFDGDREHAAVPLGDDTLRDFPLDRRYITHGDSGQVHAYDLDTGEREFLLADARYVEPVRDPDGGYHLIYQVLGDDQAEPVRVLDLASGEVRDITVNDFAAASWGRADDSAGFWTTAVAGDDAVIALHGPGGQLVEAYSLGTLAPLDIPDHVGTTFILGGGIGLVLDDPAAHVVALWEPQIGRVVEIYRGPVPANPNFKKAGERVHYTLANADGTVKWLAVDLTTGETATVLPRVGPGWTELADGRILSAIRSEDGDRVEVIDLETSVADTLVERAKVWQYAEDFGVVYLDADGDEPGIWAVPLPPK